MLYDEDDKELSAEIVYSCLKATSGSNSAFPTDFRCCPESGGKCILIIGHLAIMDKSTVQ